MDGPAPAHGEAAPATASLPAPNDPVAGSASASGNGTGSEQVLKRKRTPSDPPSQSASAPQQKTQKTTNAHLAINYLARQYEEDLPLISTEDSLPSILNLVGEYQGVLERHESMACNLGARPLGPILIKRFERLFDGPPRILKNHGKDGNSVSWLDVVEFARAKPEQFVLGQMSEGVQVCQIHTKQCRVQISEEDFMLVSSGMPQKLIPPQPIVEDEEKELGTLEILEKNLSGISHLADQVAARTRQLKHRINGRRQAILERRANEPGPVIRGTSPSVLNGSGVGPQQSPYSKDANGNRPAEFSKTGASSATKSELLGKFFTQSEKERRDAERYGGLPPLNGGGDLRRYSTTNHHQHGHQPQISRTTSSGSISHPPPPPNNNQYRDLHPRDNGGTPYNGYGGASHAPSTTTTTNNRPFDSHLSKFRPAQPTPSSTHAHTYGDTHSTHAFSVPPTPSQAQGGVLKEVKPLENDGPYRAEMVARMEALKKGERVLPPCDRCRRLHMDCIKNLTACAGCTRKHAKCSWRDVRESELWGPGVGKVAIPVTSGGGGGPQGMEVDPREREPSVGLRPGDEASVQLLQALGGAEHHHQEHHHNNGFARDARAMALEGLSAAEQHANGGPHDPHLPPPQQHGEYHSPPHQQQTSNYPSRPPSSGPYPSHAQETPGQHYAPYDAPMSSREVGTDR